MEYQPTSDQPLEPIDQYFSRNAKDYESYHLPKVGGLLHKEMAVSFLPDETKTLLDLGCGTGLELDFVYRRFPNAQVTGVDIAEGMLAELRRRLPNAPITLHCGSYFDFPIQALHYDAVLSVMSLHHFDAAKKLPLYQRIRAGLKPGGCFLLCDRFALSQEEEDRFHADLAAQKEAEGLSDGMYHFDIPTYFENELQTLRTAGFSAELVWQEETTCILKASC